MPPLHITVAAIAERAGRFLLVEERIGERRLFNQPAGHVEPGEHVLHAVAREALEETAWVFEPEALVGIYLWHSPREHIRFLRFSFCGVARQHDPRRPLDRGIVGTHWLTLAELEKHRARLRSPLVLLCVRDYLAGARRDLATVAGLDRELAAASLDPSGPTCRAGPVTVVA
jgi:8-oxo-dGTP pyrophosphatase MutT (NUDIX family)